MTGSQNSLSRFARVVAMAQRQVGLEYNLPGSLGLGGGWRYFLSIIDDRHIMFALEFIIKIRWDTIAFQQNISHHADGAMHIHLHAG